MQKVILAIALYERVDYLKMMSASLEASGALGKVQVNIYDDCSPTLKEENIRKIIPYVDKIVRRPQNLGADLNMRTIFSDFLREDGDILLLADSDLIFRPGWLEKLLHYIPQTDGVLSLYNSRCHPFLGISSESCEFGAKQDLGAAGTAFSRERVQEIVEEYSEDIPSHATFDWIWSEMFRERGIKLYCVRESYIQHIGILGTNNSGRVSQFDCGLNFFASNPTNDRIISRFVEDLISEQKLWEQRWKVDKLLDMLVYGQKLRARPWGKGKRISWLHYFRVQVRKALIELLYRL